MKTKAWITLLIVAIALAYFMYGNMTADPLDYILKDHTDIVLHKHIKMNIEFLGESIDIPQKVGITSKGMRVIHTHDGSGEIHIEGPYAHQYYLRDFFKIWGKNFNRTCLFDECINENYTLQFFVNGKPNSLFENLPLVDDNEIKIIYAKKI